MTGQLASVIIAAVLLAAAVYAWPSPSARAARRVAALTATGADISRPISGPPAGLARAVASLVAGCAVALFVGLPWGAPVGVLAVVLGYLALARFEPVQVRRRRERLVADFPVAVDLLAACLRAGSTPTAAAAAVSKAVGGPIGEALHGVVSLSRLGGDPVESWSVLDRDAPLAPLARAVGRAMSSGAPVVTALEHVAVDARRQRQAVAEEAARKVGVRAAAPLGLCFLPAFVLLGVVPVAAGIASNVDLW